ncbi:hypothetical protein T4A_6831 [Trichinella pseudospiralis]|uniref:Uncharacterized protein n=1 Tax=Trichinella pseudospiralis TaxID=6337 RepID=A0A0V1F1C1_TRIPS|nr:hypothetical protein T4A_6831 [Trichinella pseudospiralis]
MKSANPNFEFDVAKVWAKLREAINATDSDNCPEEKINYKSNEDSLLSAEMDVAEMEMYGEKFQIEQHATLNEFQSKFTSEKVVEILLIIKEKCTSLCKVLHHNALSESEISKNKSVLLPKQIYILAKSVIDILIKDKRKEICDDLQQCVQAIPLYLEGYRPPPVQINESDVWYNVALNLTMSTLFPLTSVANNVSELLLRTVFGNKEGNATDWSDENAPPSPLLENGINSLLFYDLLVPVSYGLGWFVGVLLLTLIYCACASRKKADAQKKSPIIALNAILLLLVMAMSVAMIALAFFAVTGSPAMHRGLSNLQDNVFPMGNQLYQLVKEELDDLINNYRRCLRKKRNFRLPEETEFYNNCKVALKYIEPHIEEFKTECMSTCNTECRMTLNSSKLFFKHFSSSDCDEYFSSKDADGSNIMKTTKYDENIEASSLAADQNLRYKRHYVQELQTVLAKFGDNLHAISIAINNFGDSLRHRVQYFLQILSPYLIFARYISILVLYWLLGISLLYCMGSVLMTKRIFQKGVASNAKFKIFRSGASCATATSFLIACYLCFWIAIGGYVYILCENSKNVEERSGLHVITHDDLEKLDLFGLAIKAIYAQYRRKDEPLNDEDSSFFMNRFRRNANNFKSASYILKSCKQNGQLSSTLDLFSSNAFKKLRQLMPSKRYRRQSNGSAHQNFIKKNHTLDALEKLILHSNVENESCTRLKWRIVGFVKVLHNFMLKAESGNALVKRQKRQYKILPRFLGRFYDMLKKEILECDTLIYQFETFYKAICVDIAIPFNMYWIVIVLWTVLAYFAAYLALIIEYSYGENYAKQTDDVESSRVSNKEESTAEAKSEAEKSAVSKVTSQSEIKDAAQSSVSKAVDRSRRGMSRYDFGDFSAISRHTAHVRKRLTSYASEAAGRMRDRYERVRRRRHRGDRYDESVGEPRRRRWRDRIDFRSRDRYDESEVTRARESEDSRR